MGLVLKTDLSNVNYGFGIPSSAGGVISPGTFSKEMFSNDTFPITEPQPMDLLSSNLSRTTSQFIHSLSNNGSKLLYTLPLLTNFLDAHSRPVLTDFPKVISLADRSNQSSLGTTSHLPEWWLSDTHTGYLNIKNPGDVNQGFLDIRGFEFNPNQGETTVLFFDPKLNQGLTSIAPFNFNPNQGFILINTVISNLLNQGDITLNTFNPNINQGDSLVNVFNPLINQGIAVILPYVNNIIQGSILITVFNPNIIQGSVDIVPVLVNINQGGTDVSSISFIPAQGGLSISYTQSVPEQDAKVGINKASEGFLGLPIFDKADLLKWSANTLLTDLSINKGVGKDTENYGLGYIINSVNGEELDDENDIPFYLQRGARRKDTIYIQGVAFDTDTPIINSNYNASQKADTTDPVKGGYKQRNFSDSKYIATGAPTKETELKSAVNVSSSYVETVKTDSVVAKQIDDNNLPLAQNIPGGSIVTGVDILTSRNDKLSNSNGLNGTFATMAYSKLKGRAENPGTIKDFREDITGITKFNSSLDNYSTKNFNSRLGMGDLGDTSKDRSNYNNDLGLEDDLMKALGSTAADLVTLKFQDIRNNLPVVQFRSYIESFSDSITPSVEEYEYVGRPDKLDVYTGISRTANLTFIVPALTKNELKFMYQKLNYLIGLTLPDKPGMMVAPFVKFTFGDWFKSIPSNLRSLTFDMDKDFVWEINMEGDKKLGELPKFVKVSMTLAIKGNAIPSLQSNSFNIAKDRFQ